MTNPGGGSGSDTAVELGMASRIKTRQAGMNIPSSKPKGYDTNKATARAKRNTVMFGKARSTDFIPSNKRIAEVANKWSKKKVTRKRKKKSA